MNAYALLEILQKVIDAGKGKQDIILLDVYRSNYSIEKYMFEDQDNDTLILTNNNKNLVLIIEEIFE